MDAVSIATTLVAARERQTRMDVQMAVARMQLAQDSRLVAMIAESVAAAAPAGTGLVVDRTV